MRVFHLSKLVVGFLLAFQHSVANNDAPSVAVPGSVNQCGAVPLDIKGGTPPYTITIKKADNPAGAALQSFSDVNNPSSLSLPNGMATGMTITFEVKDSRGQTTHSGLSTVSSSPDCPQTPKDLASKPDDGAADSDNPADASAPPAPGPPGGDSKNSTAGTVPGAPGSSPDKSAGGAPSAPDQPPNGLNNSTAAGPQPGKPPPPSSNTTASPDNAGNATAVADKPGNNNSTDTPASVNSTATTAPRPGSTPPKNSTSTIGGNTKMGNNTSSVNNRPKPPTSESSRRHPSPLYLSLFISSLAGFLINR
ncbi:hypothetical protein PtB15_1B246 [Puccinia triticina]|nr:hypothetical protein PtB15_1B246 [Puccinia triticina]